MKVPVEWEQYNVSGETAAGEGLFQEAMESLKRNKVGLKGTSFWNVFGPQHVDVESACGVGRMSTGPRLW